MTKSRMLALSLLAALFAAPAGVLANDGDEVLAAERICQVKTQVPVIFRVGECREFDGFAFIPVLTNTRTRVQVDCDPVFTRFERDCDGRLLKTFDTIPGRVFVRFRETPHCREGAPLEVKQLAECDWCVNPHRGGYLIGLLAVPGAIDICDDAGCYTANVRVLITAQPFEDCCDVPPPPPGPGVKGNNGVGNGEDPQPPGNPPVNDGPGTSPGSPGNQGGAQ